MPKLALITGATDGIGKATALRLAHEGWSVVAVGRSAEKLASLANEVRGQSPGAELETLRADLGVLAEVSALCDAFLAAHTRLDLLFLNANAITQTRRVGPEGFEANLAIGHWGRALMAWRLEGVLAATAGSQILCTVGLNLERLDFDDLTQERDFQGMRALGRWQWANQVFSRAWNRVSKVPMNIYMPGLVKTKILSTEPGPMRIVIGLLMAFVAMPTSKAAQQVLSTVLQVAGAKTRDHYYSAGKDKGVRALPLQAGDEERVWSVTREQLASYLGN